MKIERKMSVKIKSKTKLNIKIKKNMKIKMMRKMSMIHSMIDESTDVAMSNTIPSKATKCDESKIQFPQHPMSPTT